MYNPNHFPARLREARRAAGLTQEQLAAAAGLHPIHIAKMEREDAWPRRMPRWDTACALANALGCGLDTFAEPPGSPVYRAERKPEKT